ncbi:MAG TPA: wax ester/triacylglycerol synthase family O-acyltransferase [Acidimicrobiales bacterium]|nr:wax ester/triacylglycerol synthase family O-acyltransferase [Acidimicrobiales bacterium]
MAKLRFEKRMSDQDALMWAIEKDPLLRSTITSVTLLETRPDHERFAAQIEHASREIPRLRQRVVSAPFGISAPEFAIDPNFDIDYHVRYQRAPGDGTVRDLFDFAAPFAMSGFDRARPLWEFIIIDDLADGGSALVQKMHHSLTDGVGAMKLSMAFLDTTPEGKPLGPLPGEPEPETPEPMRMIREGVERETRRAMGIASRIPGQLARNLANPVESAKGLGELAGSTARMLRPVSEPFSPIMTGRSLSVRFDCLTASLPEMKAAAKTVDGKLNDAFVAGVAGGLRRYHDKHGATVDELRMTMPINIRSDTDEIVAGNQFVPARFAFPISIEDPAERMRAIHKLVDTQRHEKAMGIVDPISGVLNRLPLTLTTGLLGSMLKAIDVVTSNVPGAPMPLYIAGSRMQANFGFGPLSGAASNVTLLSYIDELHIAVSTDPAAVPDPELFVECLRDGLDEVAALGS